MATILKNSSPDFHASFSGRNRQFNIDNIECDKSMDIWGRNSDTEDSSEEEESEIYNKCEEMEKNIHNEIIKMKKKLGNNYHKSEKLKILLQLEDDLIFIQSITDDSEENYFNQKLMYDQQTVLDLSLPLDLTAVDGSCIELKEILKSHSMLFKFLYFRQIENDPLYADNYFIYTKYVNKIQVKDDKSIIMQLLMDVDYHVVSTGETLKQETTRKMMKC